MKPQINLYNLFFIVLFLINQTSFAQVDETLPKGFSEKEKAALLVKGFQFKSSATTNAPTGLVRTAAEWEEVEYLVISWNNSYNDILSEIVKASVEECKVVIARGSTSETTIRNKLTGSPYFIDLTNVIFLTAITDSIWIRDFAGNTVYSNDVGQIGLTDWRYNRPRNNDDTVPTAHSTELGIPIYVTDMVNTGGNFMSDGLGNAFASELVISENDVPPFYYTFYPAVRRDEPAIDAIMSQYMGINSYYKMPVLPYDGIHHIDMHMKLLDEETILVSTYPGNVADGAQIEANIAQLLVDKVSVFGTPYKIERIESPRDKNNDYPGAPYGYGSYCTYSNSTIVNKTILLPSYSRAAENAAAIARYEELMPGYKVVGIDVETVEDLISLSGAIHCITHTIGVAEPLLIVHQPTEEVPSGSSFTLSAMLKHIDNIKEAKVMWRIAGSQAVGSTVFPNEVLMTKDGASDDWTATMPVSASNTDIEYYIVATSNGTVEKTLTRPLTAVKTDPSDALEPIGFYTIKSNSTLSIDEWAENNISIAYPNPTYNNVSFKLNNIGSSVDVSIYNALGQKLFNKKVNSGSGIIELSLNEEWKGPLMIIFKGDFGKVVRRIIKI